MASGLRADPAPGPARRPPTLYVALSPSRRLAWVLIGLHSCAILVLLVASVPVLGKVVGSLVMLTSGMRAVRHHALLARPKSFVALRFRDPGRCEVMRRDGTCIDGRVHDGSYVLPGVTIVRVSAPARLRCVCVVVLPDAVTSDAMRRLRVWLKWACSRREEKFGRDVSL